MSLKSRLRISILVLVVSIVVVLSALYIRISLDETLTDVQERATLLAQQVKTYVLERVNQQGSPGSLEQNKRAWYNLIQHDPALASVLEKSMSNASNVVELVILDEDNRILLSSVPNRTGMRLPPADSFPNLASTPLFTKLRQVLNNTRDYAIEVPLGVPDQPRPVLTVRALLSSVLIRDEIVPQLKGFGIVCLVSILISALLSILVSNLVSSSFRRVGLNIDRVAAGQHPAENPDSDLEEIMGVQKKLQQLSQVYQGAREDVAALQRNINQLLQRLEEAVFLFDERGILRTAGKPAERLLAKSQESLLGKSIEDIFPAYTPLGAAIQSSVRMHVPLHDHPVSLDRPNLPQIRLLASVEPVASDGTDSAGTLVTIKDAESRRQLKSQLDIANRLAAIGKLSSGVAHEIKNPLNAIALHLELLRSQLSADTSKQYLDTVTQEVQRLDRVVKTFIDFNRPLEPRMRECNLVVVSRTAMSAAERSGSSRVKLSLSADLEHAPVLADAELSSQALLNVLVNAIEAMDDHSGEVKLKLRESFDEYIIDVTDQGAGIPAEIQDKIYNLYFSTKPNAPGIGLAMTFLVMQLHNGFVEFESEVGRGTTFRLHFPAFHQNGDVH